MRLHAWPAKSDKGRLVPRPERPDYFQTKAQGHALTYKRRPIVLAVVNKMRAKGSAKRECGNPSCVGVLFSPDAPLISRLRIVPPKERTYALARLARQVGQRETCSKA